MAVIIGVLCCLLILFAIGCLIYRKKEKSENKTKKHFNVINLYSFLDVDNNVALPNLDLSMQSARDSAPARTSEYASVSVM